MPRRIPRSSVLLMIAGMLTALVLFCTAVRAQKIENPQSAVDNLIRSSLKVDPATGAMQLTIPLGVIPGRGSASLPVDLNYSSKVWNIKHHSTSPCGGEPVSSYRAEFAKASASGWTSSLGWFLPTEDLSLELYEGQNGKPAQQGNPTLFRIMRKFVRLPDGSRHEVRKDDARHDLADSLFGTYYAVDGSRLMYDLATETIFLPYGARIVGNGSGSVQYVDRNGNFMTYNSGTWTDTLGRTFGVPIPGTAPAAGDVVYTLPGGLTYTMRWRNLADARTDPSQPLRYKGDTIGPINCTVGGSQPNHLFSTFDGQNYLREDGLFNPVVLWQISLPNNTNYTFTYNVYGEMDKIVYPTGGTEQFTYGIWEALGDHLGDPTYSQANRGVNSRVVSDGVTAPQVWTFGGNNFDPGVDPATDVRVVTAPNGTVTRTWYFISRGTNIKYGFDDARTGMVREVRVYNAAGTMLRRTVNQVVKDGPLPGGYETATRNARVVKTVEIILDTGGNALAASTEMTYDADLNVTSTKQYDFVSVNQTTAQTGDHTSIPVGTLVRNAETDYLTGDANYRVRNLHSLPTATRVKNGSGSIVAQSTISYDEPAFPLLTYGAVTGWSDPGTNARGNATTTSAWLNTTGGNLLSHIQYDQCGNVRKAWDAKDTSLTNPTQIEYSATFHRAYPTTQTSADPDGAGPLSSLVTFTAYDLATGLATSTTDANGQQTIFSYNDPLLRLKQMVRANGDPVVRNQTTYVYDDVARTITVTSDLAAFNDNVLKTMTIYDALGRPVESRTYEGGLNYIGTQSQYDTMGRAHKISNPFRPWQSETATWTTTTFDPLGRVLTVTTPDNSVVTTSYSGNSVTVTDQIGKKRKSVTDALGRLKEVYEDPDPPGFNYLTSYGYNVLDNLTTVTQWTQTRSFVYDSLKRLTSATNPESGTISYQYDNNNNLTQKTDARGVVTTYAYDALNRNTTINYSDTTGINPDVTRIYDTATNGKGRLHQSYSGGSDTVGTTVEHTKILSYDVLGRPLDQRQKFKTNSVWSTEYRTQRTYNLAGGVKIQTYPSGRIVTYNYDQAGRLGDKDAQNLAFTGNLGDGVNRNYSTEIIYSSLGGMAKERFGTDTPLYNKSFYNSRGQLSEIRVGLSPTGGTWERGAIINHYSSQCWGACNGTDNNGNVKSQDHWIPNASGGVQAILTQSFAYDNLNRLLRANEGSSWQQEFVYDRWGNRTIHQTNSWGTGINKKDFTVNTANNRLGVPAGQSGVMSYDAAGNLTNDTYTGAGSRVYDAENRMTKAWGGNNQWQEYTYNAQGQRTRRKIDGVETRQVYGIEGELLAEYAADATPAIPQKEYGYRNGQVLVTVSNLKGNWKFEENSGTTAADSAGNGHTGTLTSGAGWTTGQTGSSVNLDGVNDYVQVGAQSSLIMTSTASFSSWIYPTGPGSDATFGGIIVNKEGEYEIARTPSGTIQWAFANSNPGWNWISTGAVAPLNQWSHIAVTYDNGTIKTYFNGNLVHTYNGAGSIGDAIPSQNDFRIGGRQASAQYFQGRIDEVRVYNRALTASEVSSLLSGGLNAPNINWLVADQLGTPRITLDKTGSLATTKRHDYLPFGEELFAGMGGRTTALGYTSDATRQKFTSKERDSETGLDYFLARYYSSMQGRFSSPDEFTGGPDEYYEFSDLASQNPTFYADLTDPQSLNKYHYAYNNPLLYIDPEGHQGVREHARRVFEGGKAVVKAGADTQIAVDKVAANLVIGAMNIGNAAIGGPQTAPYEPSGAVQEVAMHALEVGTLFSPLAGKGGPATVMVAETKQTTVVSAEVGNARVAAAEASVGGSVSAGLGRSAITRTSGTQAQKTTTTVTDRAGSTTYKTAPGKTGGQSTMIVRRDTEGNVKYVKQEARHRTRDFNKPPDHVHYKRPKDKTLK